MPSSYLLLMHLFVVYFSFLIAKKYVVRKVTRIPQGTKYALSLKKISKTKKKGAF